MNVERWMRVHGKKDSGKQIHRQTDPQIQTKPCFPDMLALALSPYSIMKPACTSHLGSITHICTEKIVLVFELKPTQADFSFCNKKITKTFSLPPLYSAPFSTRKAW